MRKASILVVLAALTVLAFTAGPAHAARGMKVAIEDEDVFITGHPDVSIPQGYAFLNQLGIKNMRVLITEASVQEGGGFDFHHYLGVINQANQNGVAVQVVLVGRYPKPNIPEFTRFATAAATALAGRVTFYSIWNEPNLKAWIRSRSRATIYRNLYVAGYKAVRAADPRAKILIGETSPFARGSQGTPPLRFLRQVACVNNNYKVTKRCPKLKANGYAHHPYDFEKAPKRSNRGPDNATIGTLKNLTGALTKLQRSGQIKGTRNVYLTEFGYLATGRRGFPRRSAPPTSSRATRSRAGRRASRRWSVPAGAAG